MVEAMDSAVGKVMKALDDNGIADDTIVIFFPDNGGLSTSEGSPTSNLPFRAGKGWMYEGGIREPLIVRWPKTVKGGTVCDTPVISTDFYPTLLEACGLDPLPEQHKDGVSFVDLLKDPKSVHKRAPLFWHYPHWGNQGGIPSSAIREGNWKLAAKNPEKAAALKAKLDQFRKDTDAIAPAPNPKAKKDFNKW